MMKRDTRCIGLEMGALLVSLVMACNGQPQPSTDRQAPGKPENEARVTGPGTSFPTNDAIAYSLRFAAAMPGDEDAALTQCKTLEEVAQACLDRDADRAFAVAKTIRGWQRGTVCADVARAYALAGRTNDARRVLVEAEAWCGLYREKFQENPMRWVTGRIRQHIVIARTALGETNAYEMVQQPLDNPSSTVVNHLVAGDTNRDSAAFMQMLSVLMTNKSVEVQQGLGLGILAWATRPPALSTQALDEVVAAVRSSLRSQPALLQIPVQQNLARLLLAHGRTGEVERTTRDLEAFVRSLPAGYARGSSLADAAAAWLPVDANRAALLFEEARAEIAKSPAASRAYGYTHLAEYMYGLGQTDQAQQIYRKAVEASVLMQHPTLRLQQLVEVCASMGGAGVSLTPEMRKQLDALAAKEEAAAKAAPKLPDWASGLPENRK